MKYKTLTINNQFKSNICAFLNSFNNIFITWELPDEQCGRLLLCTSLGVDCPLLEDMDVGVIGPLEDRVERSGVPISLSLELDVDIGSSISLEDV